MARGVCKIKDGWADQDSVIVRYDDGTKMEVPASVYENDGYDPPLQQLPPCPPKAEAERGDLQSEP